MRRSVLASLRKSREVAQAISFVCGSPARLPKPFLPFAGTPRGCRKEFWPLRKSRERAKVFRHACGQSARPLELSDTLAGHPRAFRRRPRVCIVRHSVHIHFSLILFHFRPRFLFPGLRPCRLSPRLRGTITDFNNG